MAGRELADTPQQLKRSVECALFAQDMREREQR
jgi:hypothetical protein